MIYYSSICYKSQFNPEKIFLSENEARMFDLLYAIDCIYHRLGEINRAYARGHYGPLVNFKDDMDNYDSHLRKTLEFIIEDRYLNKQAIERSLTPDVAQEIPVENTPTSEAPFRIDP